tara:strand:- start:5279 stop:5698 length:420 start_codon:yes stop_codon:yes gene_type:complete
MNNEDLLKALDNDANSSIMKLNSKKIKQEKFDILKELNLDREELINLMNKLKNYRFVDDLQDINYGAYIRWIKIKDLDQVKLSNGGIIIDIKIYDDGCQVICKNMYNRIMQIKLNEAIVFQKLTDQEYVILSALDYLNT